jgi:hypothetical protein
MKSKISISLFTGGKVKFHKDFTEMPTTIQTRIMNYDSGQNTAALRQRAAQWAKGILYILVHLCYKIF